MATIKPIFKLKEPKGEKETLIILKIYFNRECFTYSTGKKIAPNLWNPETEKPFLKNGEPGLKIELDRETLQRQKDLNFVINLFHSKTEKIFSHFEKEEIIPTIKQIKHEFDKVFKSETIEKKGVTTLNSYISQYISDIETGKILTDKGERYKPGTIKNYQGFKTQFDLFQLDPRDRPAPKVAQDPKKRKHTKKPKRIKSVIEPKFKRNILDFKDITIDFYDQFVSYFTLKNLSPNTIGRHIKNLKTIMRSAKESGYHTNTETERKKFKTLDIEVENIYLTEKEVNRIFKLDLSGDKSLDEARDIFLIGVYTAQRVSDFATISKKNLLTFDNGTKVLTLTQSKTRSKVFIPIRTELEQILKKYQYEPPRILEQKLNEKIKIIGKKAEINAITLVNEIKGGMIETKEVPKYELIKTHTARRSGITNMYLAGLPTIDIMKISGHKTEREFQKYIKVSKEQTAQTLSNHPYFNTVLKIAQ